MTFSNIGLSLGYECTARCRSCLWGDQLGKKESMNVKDAFDWIDQAYELGWLTAVGYSGGEPFLYYDKLKTLAGYVFNKYGLAAVISTNAYWAKTPAETRDIVRTLHGIGLRFILISVDDFHQEYVPLERVKNCLDVSRDFGINITLQTIVTESSRKMDYYLERLGVGDDDDITATEVPCTPTGRAATHIPGDDFILRDDVLSDYCTMLRAVLISPEGGVYLCCGAGFHIPIFKAGDLTVEPLKDILDRAEMNPIYNSLALYHGPEKLAEALRENGRYEAIRNKYATTCHACQHILGSRENTRTLNGILEPQRDELFFKRTISHQLISEREREKLII
ncbi:MAG: radical SAM protein [bacterium]|nr:radical SAM protein [bacterium]